jgi:alanine racemase
MQLQRRPMVNQIRRDAWVEVNLSHIEHNIKEIKKLLKPNVKILAVVKADSYGHGSVMSASTLLASGVHMLGVASVDEGLQLRHGGITAPILVLGDTPEWAIESAVQNDISISIFTKEHLRVCRYLYEKSNISPKVHIKINTGMNRIGVNFKDAKKFIQNALNEKSLNVKGIFTHLACAENKELTNKQIEKWLEIYNEFKNDDIIFHAANTAAVLAYPELQFDMVRVGIGISGMTPDLVDEIKAPNLKQVMALKARIVHISEIEKDEGVSYGYSYIAEEKRKIATIPIGYADGVSRSLSNKIYGIINGQKVKQIGNITMDQTVFDITNVENINKGDIITLLGQDGDEFISIDEWAKILGTINYEISCNLKVRLSRIYIR